MILDVNLSLKLNVTSTAETVYPDVIAHDGFVFDNLTAQMNTNSIATLVCGLGNYRAVSVLMGYVGHACLLKIEVCCSFASTHENFMF